MTLLFVDRDVPLSACTPWDGRVVVACVVHDTETTAVPFPKTGASWHWAIARDGTAYRDVSEEYCAHHVRAADRWAPPWLHPIPASVGVSNVNGCTIGVELVSHQQYRDAGMPYTDAQYATLRALCGELNGTYGDLPYVAHGELQLDRSDPVSLDWTRAGFGPRTAQGRYLLPAEEDDMALRDELTAMTKARDDLQGINKTLGEQLAYKDQLLQEANSQAGAQKQRADLLDGMVVSLQAQVESLGRQIDAAGHRSAREVVVVLDDGTSQRFAPTIANGGN